MAKIDFASLRTGRAPRRRDLGGSVGDHVRRFVEEAASARQGCRNHELNRAAFIVAMIARDAGEQPSRYEADLVAAGVAAGLPKAEAEQTVKSGLYAKPARHR